MNFNRETFNRVHGREHLTLDMFSERTFWWPLCSYTREQRRARIKCLRRLYIYFRIAKILDFNAHVGNILSLLYQSSIMSQNLLIHLMGMITYNSWWANNCFAELDTQNNIFTYSGEDSLVLQGCPTQQDVHGIHKILLNYSS